MNKVKNIKINKMYDSTIATLSQKTCGVYCVSSGFLKEGRIKISEKNIEMKKK